MSKNDRIEDAERDLAAELLAAAKEIKSYIRVSQRWIEALYRQR